MKEEKKPAKDPEEVEKHNPVAPDLNLAFIDGAPPHKFADGAALLYHNVNTWYHGADPAVVLKESASVMPDGMAAPVGPDLNLGNAT